MKWFDVKKTLPTGPNADRKVLAYGAAVNEMWTTRGVDLPVTAATHWAELPEPPKPSGYERFTTYKLPCGLVAIIDEHRVDVMPGLLKTSFRGRVFCGAPLPCAVNWDENGKTSDFNLPPLKSPR